MTESALRLGQVAERTAMLDVTCHRCDRRGRLSTAALLGEHGPDMPMPALLVVLTSDCPRRKSGSLYRACGAHFPQLPALFLE
jgi:hypothetical protein